MKHVQKTKGSPSDLTQSCLRPGWLRLTSGDVYVLILADCDTQPVVYFSFNEPQIWHDVYEWLEENPCSFIWWCGCGLWSLWWMTFIQSESVTFFEIFSMISRVRVRVRTMWNGFCSSHVLPVFSHISTCSPWNDCGMFVVVVLVPTFSGHCAFLPFSVSIEISRAFLIEISPEVFLFLGVTFEGDCCPLLDAADC